MMISTNVLLHLQTQPLHRGGRNHVSVPSSSSPTNRLGFSSSASVFSPWSEFPRSRVSVKSSYGFFLLAVPPSRDESFLVRSSSSSSSSSSSDASSSEPGLEEEEEAAAGGGGGGENDDAGSEIDVQVISSEKEDVEKPQRKPRIKLGEIMGILNQRAVEARDVERPIPDIRTGDVVEIKLQVPENKRRLATYKGIVMSRQNAGIHSTIRIRRIIAGVGVEIVFPLYSPMVKEIKVIDQKKVRKARLYYLRDKLPRFSTFK